MPEVTEESKMERPRYRADSSTWSDAGTCNSSFHYSWMAGGLGSELDSAAAL